MDPEGLDGSRGVQCIPRGSVDVEVLFNGSRKVQWVPRLSRDNGSAAPPLSRDKGDAAPPLSRDKCDAPPGYPGIGAALLPFIPG